MHKAKDFGQEIGELARDVDKDVRRYVKVLRQTDASQMAVPTEEDTTGRVIQPTTDDPESCQPRLRRNHTRPMQRKPNDRSLGMMNVTTRLSVAINDQLTDAALRQRLAKKTPNNRQDIIGTALCEWLRRNGYDN